MSVALSPPPSHLGQLVSVDVNRIGTRSSFVPDVAPNQAFSHNDKERNVENATDVKLTGSQTPVANSKEGVSSGTCSMIRTEGGVAEFKGPIVHGLVRFVQVNERESQIEASFDGLIPGPHTWSVNEFGDVRDGAASTGLPYSPSAGPLSEGEMAVGMLGTLVADSSGHAEYTTRSSRLGVGDIIGRSVVLYQSYHKELQNTEDAIACAVIARSCVPGTNGCARQLCGCDGTVIWQSSV